MNLPDTWYNVQGHKLKIKDMDSDHIKNCVFHLASRGLTEGIYPLASIGTRTRHPEAFRYELRRRRDVLLNTYGENLAVF